MSQSWDHCHWEGLRILSVCLKIAPHYLGPDPEVAGISETSLHLCPASLFNCDIGNTPRWGQREISFSKPLPHDNFSLSMLIRAVLSELHFRDRLSRALLTLQAASRNPVSLCSLTKTSSMNLNKNRFKWDENNDHYQWLQFLDGLWNDFLSVLPLNV